MVKNRATLLLALVLSACGSSKQQTQSEYRQAISDTVSLSSVSEALSTGVLEEVLRNNVCHHAVITVYDTEKAVEPASGRPPVKADIRIETTGSSSETRSVVKADTIRNTTRMEMARHENETLNKETENIRQESNQLRYAGNLVIALLLFTVVGFLIWKFK